MSPSSGSSGNSNKAPRTGGVRFAPSPTGLFHVGNLRTAWVSHQWAKTLGAPWVVRMEDIDTPRIVPGAREQQLVDMAALGLRPDVLLTQSGFHTRHEDLFTIAVKAGRIYPCDCSRKDVRTALANLASAPHEGQAPVYSGRCRSLDPRRELLAQDTIAWRFRMPDSSGCDDFIVARSGSELDHGGLPSKRDSLTFAYHWACAIDDYDGDYQLIVRSHDLEPAAPLQRAIQQWVGELEGEQRRLAIFHTSLVTQNDGHRLEKRSRGVTLAELNARGLSNEALREFFAKSFDSSLFKQTPAAGSLEGEARESLPLSVLIGFDVTQEP